MRARAEPFGAWIRDRDGTLVAVDRAAARRLGVDGGALWQEPPARARRSAPLEVHVAVTSRCGAGCSGCYLDARPDGDAPPFEVLAARLDAIARAGVFTVAFGGGEPLSRPDLAELAAHAHARGLVPVVTTSGIGMTRERAASLRAFAQVNVSYDGPGEAYAAVRGFDGARVAERAMSLLAEAGVPFGVNVVLTRTSFPALGATIARATELGAREAQLLRYKPAGRARGATYLAARLSPEQVDALAPALEALVRGGAIPIRVDCALVPLLATRPIDPVSLVRFGVLGCEAGRHLAAVRVDGAVAPCSFADASALDASVAFGDARAWSADATLESLRALHDAEPCRSCELRDVCRGGCRVVAAHVDGAVGPDPECPRVRRARAAARSRDGAG